MYFKLINKSRSANKVIWMTEHRVQINSAPSRIQRKNGYEFSREGRIFSANKKNLRQRPTQRSRKQKGEKCEKKSAEENAAKII